MHGEARALAYGAVDGQQTFVAGDDVLNDGQTQTQATFGITPRVIELAELFKDLTLFFFTQPLAVVTDLQLHFALLNTDMQPDLPRLGMPQGVAQQIA